MDDPGERRRRRPAPWLVVVALAVVAVLGVGLLSQRGGGSQFVMTNSDPGSGANDDPASSSGSTGWWSHFLHGGSAQPVRATPAGGSPTSVVAQPSWPPTPTLAAAANPVVRRLAGWDSDDAQCVSFVKSASPAQAITLLGGNPAKRVPAGNDPGLFGRSYVAGVGTRAGWAVVSGWNGYSCSDEEVLKRLTAHGVEAVTVYWNSDIGTASLSHYADGHEVSTWDQADDQTSGPQSAELDPLKTSVAADLAAFHESSALMAMAAGLTGVELPYDWKPDYWVRIPNP